MPAPPTQPVAALAAVLLGVAPGAGPSGLARWVEDPRVAFLLLALGTVSILVELAHPAVPGTGVGGALAVLAGLWCLSQQSVSAVGLGLMVLAAGLWAAELLTPASGVAGALGAVALALGGLLLVDGPSGGVPAAVVVPTALVLGAAVVAAGRLGWRSRGLPSTLTGGDALIGRDLTVAESDGGTGRAFVHGAWWQVRSVGPPLGRGTRARVVSLDGLVLVVDPRPPLDDEPPWRHQP